MGDEQADPCSIAAMQIYWCEVGKTGTNLTIVQLRVMTENENIGN